MDFASAKYGVAGAFATNEFYQDKRIANISTSRRRAVAPPSGPPSP